MTKIIEVIVSPQGGTKIETKGFAGNACQQASRFLEHALGTSVSEEFTAEFFETQPQEQVLRQGGAP